MIRVGANSPIGPNTIRFYMAYSFFGNFWAWVLLGREIAFFCRTLDSVSCHLRLLEPWLSLDHLVRSYVGSQKLR